MWKMYIYIILYYIILYYIYSASKLESVSIVLALYYFQPPFCTLFHVTVDEPQ